METHWAIFTAITLGAGVHWHEHYDTVDQIGRMMVSRSSHGGSIGAAGGWLKEEGTVRCRLLTVLVWLSLLCFLRAYTGSGVDNEIEFTVVTCGEYLTTNNYRDSDLF